MSDHDRGRYRRLYALEWHDPNFRRLNDGARVVRLYVTAGPQTTSVGCFRLSTALAVEDLGGTPEEFENRLTSVCETFAWAWDPLARVIWIRDWFDFNPPASPNVVASWAKLLKNVPACDVRDEAFNSIAASLKNLPATFREPWTELSKLLRRTEIRPETHQGSGNRDSGIQGTENRRAARGKAENGTNGNGQFATSPLDPIVREASRHFRREDDTEFKLDTIRQFLPGTQRDTPKQELLASLARVEARTV